MGKRSTQGADRPMDFNVREYKKFTDMILNIILQLTFKKLPLTGIWHSIKGDSSHSYEETTEELPRFLTTYISV